MTKSNRALNGQEGIALFAALILLALVTFLMGSLSIRVLTHNNHVTNYGDFKDAYHGMESAMALSLQELTNGGDGWIGVDGSYYGGNVIPTFYDDEVTPLVLPGTDIEYFAYTIDWSNDGVDNVGNGTIDGVTESTMISIHVRSRVASVIRRGVGIFGQQDGGGGGPSIWDNAIFGGPGKRNQQQTIFYVTKGSKWVKIHGPVHILGDDIKNGDTALNLTKNSYIRNSYDGVPSSITDNIPTLETNDAGDATLNATLRVKQGAVHISAGGQHAWIGQQDDQGINTNKETIDGLYVDDGFTGNDTEGVTIFSDNGALESYETELGNNQEFPTYADDGGRDHMDYYLEGFDAGGGSDYKTIDNIKIEDKNFYWNASDGVKREDESLGSGGMPDYDDLQEMIDDDEYFIWWDANEEQMVINGRIAIEGDFETELIDIYYHGKGSIMTMDTQDHEGSVQMTIKSSLIPRSITDFDESNPQFNKGGFPADNLLGLMSSYKITFDLDKEKTHSEVYAAIYCQDLIEIEEKGDPTSFIGGMASDRFKAKGHTRFVHVPDMDDSWGDGMRMIGANPGGGGGGLALNIAWYEVGFTN